MAFERCVQHFSTVLQTGVLLIASVRYSYMRERPLAFLSLHKPFQEPSLALLLALNLTTQPRVQSAR